MFRAVCSTACNMCKISPLRCDSCALDVLIDLVFPSDACEATNSRRLSTQREAFRAKQRRTLLRCIRIQHTGGYRSSRTKSRGLDLCESSSEDMIHALCDERWKLPDPLATEVACNACGTDS